MVLTIDGQVCDGGQTAGALGRYDDAQLTHPFLRRDGERLEVLLEDTPKNRAILGHPYEVIEAERFNGEQHTATVEIEGVPFITGYARLLEFSDRTGYRVEIHAPGASWTVSAALGMLRAAGVDWQGYFDFQQIAQSWEQEGAAVCFLPVFRDGFEPLHPSGYTEVERILPATDYHPFLRLYDLVQAIFCRAGYKLVSEFFESAFFRSLYMSGAYASTDTSTLQRRYGFFARRKGDVSATANASGRVYTSLPMHASTLGPIVNAFNPLETDASGQPMSDIYNNGALVIEEGEPVFKPRNRVKASFHFHLEYTTDYRILSRTQLAGFDTFYLGDGITLQGQLTNLFVDKRNDPLPTHSYTVIVFEAPADNRYRVVDGSGSVMASFTGRTGQMVTSSTWTPSPLTLQLQTSGGWVSSALDWALYNGSIGERGTKRVEIDCVTPVVTVTPDGRHFHSVYFAGAEEGMTLTLHEGTSLGVDFSQRPGFGSLVHFYDVARHPIRQSVLVEALIHLFNLRVYTDTEALEICVEPEAQFYDRSHVVDWSDRVDSSQPIVRRDRALDEHESRLYRYAGNPVDDLTDTPYAAWRISTQNFATQDGCEKRINPLFGAVSERDGFRINAPSAEVIAPEESGDEDNFIPCIVSFQGLQPLPEGEVWGWPAPDGLYPAARFSKTADGMSLCFDGTNTAMGLRQFHDHEEERRSFAQQVTLTLRLQPEEVALLRHRAQGDIVGCNSLFRLTAQPDGDLYLLRHLEQYDPETHTARCVFESAL